MADPKKKTLAGKRNMDGIVIEYIRRRGVLRLSGWYSSVLRVPEREMTLRDFLRELGIERKDLDRALGETPR